MVSNLLLRALDFYEILIFIYILLSWLPASGAVWEIRRLLATVCEPYLGIFRRIVPPVGMIDISPIVAILVLQLLVAPLISALLGQLGL